MFESAAKQGQSGYNSYQDRDALSPNYLGNTLNKLVLPHAQTAGLGALANFRSHAQSTMGASQTDFRNMTLPGHKVGPRPPQKLNQTMASNQQKKFSYEYDFDENGALFFLGSGGKRRLWQNPHDKYVQAFASSIGAGHPSNFVGREATNCRTQNEVTSYFGVDLREGRHLLPDFYTLRNRNSTTHALMNWVLEGSVDKIDWRELDRRIHIHQDGTLEDE